MSQTSYDRDQNVAYAGMKADAEFDKVISRVAEGVVPFGSGVGAETGDNEKCRVPAKDNASLAFDADFVTSNKINGTVNGVAWTEVDFDTDHDTTAAALAAAIDALDGVTCTLDSTDANKRTFLIEMEDGSAATITSAVTGGASQATGTPTYTSDDLFRGVALQTHKEQSVAGVSQYNDTEAVSVMTRGEVWVPAAVALAVDDTVYVTVDGTGKFTNVSSGNMATGAKVRGYEASLNLARIELNIP